MSQFLSLATRRFMSLRLGCPMRAYHM
jgi:hypothetical protein